MATFPGIYPNFSQVNFSDRHKVAIQRLAKYFFITTPLDVVEVGKSAHRGFLMRPADGISTILNVDREIVVLFADYDNFDSRSLAAFDKVYSRFSDERLDKTIRILISKDNEITDKIRHFLHQEPEYPII